MKKSVIRIIAMLMIFVFLFAVSAFAGEASDGQTKDELVIGTYQDHQYVGNFDAFGYVGSTCASPTGYGSMIWEKLFYFARNGEIASDILASYEWSEDYLTLTMTLKDGIMFSNGTQMTAEDVLWSLDQVHNSPNGLFSTSFKKLDTENSTISEDGLTLNLKYTEVDGPTLGFLCMITVLSKQWFEDMGGSWDNIDVYDINNIVGSGPYKCVEFESGSHAVYELRDDYWGFEQGITWPVWKTIRSYVYTDQTTLGVDLENGKLDVATNISTGDYDRLVAGSKENLTAYLVDANAVAYIMMSVDNKYLQDPKIREAIVSAIDIDAITYGALGSVGTTATSILAPDQFGYEAGNVHEYNPELAMQLMQEAGVQPGEIKLTYAVRNDALQQNTAEAIKAYLSMIGIDVDIVTYDNAGWYASQRTPGFTDLYYHRVGQGCPSGDPGVVFNYLPSNGGVPYLARDTYDEYLMGANATQDLEEKAALYGEFQRKVKENCDAFPLYQWSTAVGYNTEVLSAEPFFTLTLLPYLIPAE